MKQEALAYAQAGYRIFPVHSLSENGCTCGKSGCKSQGKHPMIRDWQNEASSDADTIEQWWSNWPSANIGLVTGPDSGILVLDADLKHDGLKSMEALITQFPEISEAPRVKTGGGGFHYYFRYPVALVKNSAGKLAKGVDVRAKGGYIVAPPSLHASGNRYCWEENHLISHAKPLSEGLLQAILSKKGKKPRKGAGVIPQSERNDTLFRSACRLRSKGKNEEEILDALMNLNQQCVPPLESAEIEQIAESAMRYDMDEPEEFYMSEYRYTDMGNAERLAEENQDTIRYLWETGEYAVYTGEQWLIDTNKQMVMAKAAALVKDFYAEAETEVIPEKRKKLGSHAKRSSSAGKVQSMVSLIHVVAPEIGMPVEQLDHNPKLLNMKNGCYDFDKNKLLPHDPMLYQSKMLPYAFDPDANCPLWIQFLETMFEGDLDIIEYLQRALGYSLTGSQDEQCLFYLYGDGKNGKSTFIEVIQVLFGQYAHKAGFGTILRKKHGEGIPNDVAQFRGRRLVTFSEIPQDAELDEAKVKDLTGGDQISARFLRQEFFNFTPTHTLWMYGNHKPFIKGRDEGIWRRIKLILCPHEISERERDKSLKKKLFNELPGIFNWALEGYQKYIQDGLDLKEPQSVTREVLSYRGDMDYIQHFLDEMTIADEDSSVSKKELYQAFNAWCTENGHKPLPKKAFSEGMSKNPIPVSKTNGSDMYRNIRMVPNQ